MKLLNKLSKKTKWFFESNRPKHFKIGILTGLIGTILCTAGAAIGAEYKDKQYGNAFDWLDVLATMLGGIVGQLLQIIIYNLIF